MLTLLTVAAIISLIWPEWLPRLRKFGHRLKKSQNQKASSPILLRTSADICQGANEFRD